MSESKHYYVTEDGKVVGELRGRASIGRVIHKTTRYNLRRVFVVREWVALPDVGAPKGSFKTRAEAVAYVVDVAPLVE